MLNTPEATSLFVIVVGATHHKITSFTPPQTFAFHRTITSNAVPTTSCKYEAIVLHMAKKVGIFFGTSTGSTEAAAYSILESLGGPDATGCEEPIEIDSLGGKLAKTFQEYESLIVGTPTWNTGADTERSGTGWDELYYGEMQDLNLGGKKVAVFGLGDSVSYAENYADASGELHDVFENLGCKLYGYTSQEGYEHEASKAIRGDKFCGLLLDAVNQEDMTEERVNNWVAQLMDEGFLEAGNEGTSSSTTATPTSIDEPVTVMGGKAVSVVEASTVVESVPGSPASFFNALEELEKENARLRQMMEENSRLLEQVIKSAGNVYIGSDSKNTVGVSAGEAEGGAGLSDGVDGFKPYYNPKSGRTMWVSADGKSCYYTSTGSSFKP